MYIIYMFHKAKTEKERQKISDEYLLGILKKKKVIKTNKKIIDESGFSFDPELENNKVKGAFNNYVDTLVVKNYMIEQLQTRLRISKSLSTQFVNKLCNRRIQRRRMQIPYADHQLRKTKSTSEIDEREKL